MDDLAQKKCAPCEGEAAPMTAEEAEGYLKQVPGWCIEDDGKKISRTFEFKGFKGALFFVNGVAALAEAEGHHPDIHISYSTVTLELSTHAIGGLSENDFILAAKIGKLCEASGK